MMFQNEANLQIVKEAGMVNGDYRLISDSGVNTDYFPLQYILKGMTERKVSHHTHSDFYSNERLNNCRVRK